MAMFRHVRRSPRWVASCCVLAAMFAPAVRVFAGDDDAMPKASRSKPAAQSLSKSGLKPSTKPAAKAEARPAAKPSSKESSGEGEQSVEKGAGAKPAYLDEMIREAWANGSVKPSKLATEEDFLRRAYLDIVGRIPNIQEATAYLRSRESGKRAKLVEYLLNHPDYAKNFATQWTVTLIGRQRQERQVDRGALTAWLRRQFTDSRPWNEVAYDLITAKGSNKENGAVNYALAHLEGGAVPLTSVTTRVFLGQQIQCTQCHDHPSNDWKQADFWGINAFFKGLRTREVKVASATGVEVSDHFELNDEPTNAYSSYDRRNGLVGIAFPTFLDGRKISQGSDVDRRTELGKFIADPKNENLAKAFVNRTWGHFMGRGFVNPVDDLGAHNQPSHPELLDKLAADFRNSGYDVKALIRWITASQAYQLSSASTTANEKDETLFSHMALKPMTPEQLFESLITATSAHKAGSGADTTKKRDEWMKQFIFTFGNDEGEESLNFQGTIPQSLMMMNGELMEKAVGGKPGSFLADLLAQARQRPNPELYMVNNLYLAALSRYPARIEMMESERFLRSSPDTINVLEDLFWALLNSNEFILNR